MPNNLQILAYVQAMKDLCGENIKRANERSGPYVHVLEAQFINFENLEKFIKGGK